MRHPWIQFARVGATVTGGFVLLEIVARLLSMTSRGWLGDFLPSLLVVLAGALDGLHWYLPVGALAGGIAITASDVVRRRPRLVELLGVGAGMGLLAFVFKGFVGPHVLHHALQGLLPAPGEGSTDDAALTAARALEPNDWSFFREQAQAVPAQIEYVVMIHGTVAFALLAALMLPLGLAIGHGSRRFTGRTRRRAAWCMGAATTVVVYAAQVGSWRLALNVGVSPEPLLYVGYLTVPLVMLLTLAWSGTAWASPDASRAAAPAGST